MRVNGVIAVLAVIVLGSLAGAMEISTKNNIGGHMEYAGFSVVPAGDIVAASQPGDKSAPQMFEVIRPGQQAFTLGRLYTSCTCIQITSEKKAYGSGERAFITLRNVNHSDGQMFPFYVQISRPISVVLRHDAWVKSDVGGVAAGTPVAVTPAPAAAPAPVVIAAAPVVKAAASGYQPVPLTENVTEVLASESYAVPATPAPEYVAPQSDYVMSDKDLF